jgi:hypothetical protein
VRKLVREGVIAGGRESEVNWDNVWGMCRTLVSAPHHHIEFAFDGDTAVAYIGAMRGATWFTRDRFSMVGWYSRHAGAGMALLRRLVVRAKADPDIGGILAIVNSDGDGRLAAVMRRYGAVVVPTFNLDTR